MRMVVFAVLAALLAGCGGRPIPVPSADRSEPTAEMKTSPKETGGPKQENGLIVLTPAAAAKVQEIIRDGQAIGQLPRGKMYFRVRLEQGQYKLNLDPDIAPEDRLGESRGVLTVVDQLTAAAIEPGTLVDFRQERNGFEVKSLPAVELGTADGNTTLAKARHGFRTNLTRRSSPGQAPPQPPAAVFRLVKYDSPTGKLHAYLTPDPKDGKKRPAMVWITGGDCNTIDQGCWREGAGGNDQSASAYRKAGLVMMFPSQRGGNDNPGSREAFLGEVDDIIAAADFLATQPHVDADRIYLGGHSTGGTLALLVSECTDRFRAVFSFGPVGDPRGYGPVQTPYSPNDTKEVRLRAPELWLHSIRSPTFVFEGSDEPGNVDDLLRMSGKNKTGNCRFYSVTGANHFNLLSPLNRLIATRIAADKGQACNISLATEEVNAAFQKERP